MAAETLPSVRWLLDARAASRPSAPFALFPESGRCVNCAELRALALSLALRMDGMGLSSGERVALLIPNGLGAVVGFLGVMAAGLVVMPLSLLATPQQLAYALEHANCRLILAGLQQKDVLDQALALLARPPAVLTLDPDAVGLSVADGDWPLPAPQPDDDALLMYTSGTTGRPKGVRLNHGNVLNGARFVSEAHGLGQNDRVLAVLPLYHINAQIVTVLAPLYHEGSLVMPHRFSAGRFWNQAVGCTWLNVVPTIIAYLLNGATLPENASHIRFCRSASAPLSPEHHHAFEARFGIGIIETMGLTETAAPVFTNPLDPARRKIGSPGQAFGNQARVSDPADGRPLPAGRSGEIQIRGPNVMAGYLDNPEENARVFIGDGWLRTGDLGYRDEDGFYFITGRLKELIIKGGENIAPREIDEALLRHPALLEAAAVGIPDPFYGQEIAAGVVLRPGMSATEGELKAFCEDQLGRFKTPSVVRILDELPKGPSGKVQRLKLLEDYGGWLSTLRTADHRRENVL